jgi:hypothetical protein
MTVNSSGLETDVWSKETRFPVELRGLDGKAVDDNL